MIECKIMNDYKFVHATGSALEISADVCGLLHCLYNIHSISSDGRAEELKQNILTALTEETDSIFRLDGGEAEP